MEGNKQNRNKMQKKQKEPKLIQELRLNLSQIFEDWLSGFNEKDEFYSFMSDPQEMYLENGQPSDTYCEWMKKISNYVSQHNQKDVANESSEVNDLRKEVLEKMDNYLQLKDELAQSLNKAKKESDITVIDWLKRTLAKEGMTRDEIIQNVEDFKKLTGVIIDKDEQVK